MCLGIPMRIESIQGGTARCSVRGVQRDVELFLLQHETLAPGDWVVVHVGFAIQKLAPEAAEEAWQALDRLLPVPGVED